VTKYEHKIIDARDLTEKLPSGSSTYGTLGWRVVGTLVTRFGAEVVLEREVSE